MFTEKYQCIQALNVGHTTNPVFLVERENRRYAMKLILLTDGVDSAKHHEAMDELRLLSTLRHPNIIKLRESGIISAHHRKRLVLIMDYEEGGSLGEVLRKRAGGNFPPKTPSDTAWLDRVSKWLSQICAALDYCHEKGIIHRDIKLDNILLSRDDGAVVADFGFARELSPSGQASTLIGTPVRPANPPDDAVVPCD